MKAEHYINIGYQKILTFERPGGGFDWWGSGEPLVWLSAYGVQQLSATAKVRDIDHGVIERACAFLARKQASDGSWSVVGDTHGETIAMVPNAKLALTAYVTWSLAEADCERAAVNKALSFLRKNREQADNPYLLSLMANAFAFAAPDDMALETIFTQLDKLKKSEKNQVWWACEGKTATSAYGNSADIETTAMIAYALLKTNNRLELANRAITYLIKQKNAGGNWGSTQNTILALKVLVASSGIKKTKANAIVDILLNGEKMGQWKIDEDNSDVTRLLDLKQATRKGKHKITLRMSGKASMQYQVISRYYLPRQKNQQDKENPISVEVKYDRKRLVKNDTIFATATMRYSGANPTFMVIIDLGIPPGFSVDPGDFQEMLGENKIKKFSITSRQVTLYLGDVTPGVPFVCRYQLKAKYPLKIKTPKTVAYEYYSPHIRAESKPTELTVK